VIWLHQSSLNGNWHTRIKCDWCGKENETEQGGTSRKPEEPFRYYVNNHDWVRYLLLVEAKPKQKYKTFHFCVRKCRHDFIALGFPDQEEKTRPSVVETDDSGIC